MNEKLEQYLAEQRELIANEKQRRQTQAEEEQQKQREALLDKLGIYDKEKEYIDDVFAGDYTKSSRNKYIGELVGDKMVYYRMKKVYPKLTDEEYEALLAVEKEKEELEIGEQLGRRRSEQDESKIAVAEPTEYQIDAPIQAKDTFGGGLMKVLAAIMWVGGFIVAIVFGRSPNRGGGMAFNFWLFLGYLAVFFVIGGTYWAIGELFDNVASMNSKLHGLVYAKIRETK